jgi:hypothetical protein
MNSAVAFLQLAAEEAERLELSLVMSDAESIELEIDDEVRGHSEQAGTEASDEDLADLADEDLAEADEDLADHEDLKEEPKGELAASDEDLADLANEDLAEADEELAADVDPYQLAEADEDFAEADEDLADLADEEPCSATPAEAMSIEEELAEHFLEDQPRHRGPPPAPVGYSRSIRTPPKSKARALPPWRQARAPAPAPSRAASASSTAAASSTAPSRAAASSTAPSTAASAPFVLGRTRGRRENVSEDELRALAAEAAVAKAYNLPWGNRGPPAPEAGDPDRHWRGQAHRSGTQGGAVRWANRGGRNREYFSNLALQGRLRPTLGGE